MVNICTETLITEVEKRPELWDTSNENYRDKNKKNATWVEVAMSLIQQYGNENETQQKLICKNYFYKER